MRCSSLVVFALVLAPAAEAQAPALDVRLAPDGASIAYRALDGGTARLYIRGINDSAAIAVTPAGVAVEAYAWVPDARRLVYRAADDGHLYVAGAEGPPRDLTPQATGPVRLVGFASAASAVIEVPGRWPDEPDLHRVDLATAEHAPLAVNDDGVREWLVDEDGVPRVAVRTGPDGQEELIRVRGDTLTPFHSCDVGEVCDPLGIHVDGRVWVRSSRDRDAPALVLADPLTLDEEVVRPDLAADPDAVFRSDSLFTRDTLRLREALGRLPERWQEPVAGRSRMLVTVADSAGPTAYLFDRWAGAVRPLIPLAPEGTALGGADRPVPDTLLLREVELAYRVTDDASPEAVEVRRRIERDERDGVPVWRVEDTAEVPVYADLELDTAALADAPEMMEEPIGPPAPEETTEATDVTVLDGVTLRPLERRTEGPVAIELAFGDGGVRGEVASGGFFDDVDVETDGPVWADGAALELLVAALPLAEGYRARFTLFDADALELADVTLRVTGTERVTTDAGTFDAWRLTIAPAAEGGTWQEWLVLRAGPHIVLRATERAADFERTIELTDAGGLR